MENKKGAIEIHSISGSQLKTTATDSSGTKKYIEKIIGDENENND